MTHFLAAMLCFALAILLLLHHGWKHFHEDPATSHAQRESCPVVCYFQPKDVCNFRTWNHENFILLFCFLGTVILLWSASEGIP